MIRKLMKTVEPLLIRAYRKMSDPPVPNLRGDREIEYSWIAGCCPDGPGEGMEFGCGMSHLSLTAVRRGFKMTAIDLTPVEWFYKHPDITFYQKDLFDMNIPHASLDLIINCSAVEHVGLTRYGDSGDADGDLKAMRLMRTSLKRNGVMLLTVPVGRDSVFAPLHRIYGHDRLPKLLDGYRTDRKEFWIKDDRNRWTPADEKTALDREPQAACYGLGCFVLRNP